MQVGQRGSAWLYWGSVALGCLALILAATNVVLQSFDQSLQADVNQRQQFINQTVQLSRVNDTLVRGLAATANSSNDDKLRDLLTQQGITVSPAAAPAAPAPAPAAPAAGDKKSP